MNNQLPQRRIRRRWQPSSTFCLFVVSALIALIGIGHVQAEPPSIAYIFPAGGQRGTTTNVRIGGHYLYDAPSFEMSGPGLKTPKTLQPIETIWFEGPVIEQPASQKKEDYPKDYQAAINIAADARLGTRYWRAASSQGVTPSLKFVVGDLPEVVEQEVDGRPIPTKVKLPVTINGRMFPREDVDIWTFDAQAGQTITCEVLAARIGSPLDSRLEIRDPSGKRIAENIDTFGTDSFVRFTASVDGIYAVHLHDIKFEGLQHYVYRLTVTAGPYLDFVYPLGGQRGSTVKLELSGASLPKNPVEVTLPTGQQKSFHYRAQIGNTRTNAILLELSDLPEQLEAEPNNEPKSAQKVIIPAVLNGRISKAGDIDMWLFAAKKDEEFNFDLRAARLGSPLDSVLTLYDKTEKQLAQSDDMGGGQSDSQLKFKFKADGIYTVRVEERILSRGGPRFGYRLVVDYPAKPDYRLLLSADAVTVVRGGEIKLKVDVKRSPGFQEEIDLQFDHLPAGITVTGNKIGKGKSNTQLTLKADEKAKLQTVRLKLTGKATIGKKDPKAKTKQKKTGDQDKEKSKEKEEVQEIVRTAMLSAAPGEPVIDELMLAVVLPTPFKFHAPFETKYASRGSVYVRRYKIDRGGYEGPIEISFADSQARHLQGVTGPKIVVPPGKSEFDYPVSLPSWMKIGRTSRTCLMAVAVVEDAQGQKHKVSYTSQHPDDQIILLVDPVRLSVKAVRQSLRVQAGQTAIVSVRIGRGNGLKGPVNIELVVPKHIQGVTGETMTIAAGRDEGELPIRFANRNLGPFNMPLIIRATMTDNRGFPLTSETKLEIVTPR